MLGWLAATVAEVQIEVVASISERRLFSEWTLEAAECLRVMRRITCERFPCTLEVPGMSTGPRFEECVVLGEVAEAVLRVWERREAVSLLWSRMQPRRGSSGNGDSGREWEGMLLLLLLRIEAGRDPGSVGRRERGARLGDDLSIPDRWMRDREPDCVMRGDGGIYGSTGISETRLIVALELVLRTRGIASGTSDVSGATRRGAAFSAEGFLRSALGVGWVSTMRGILRSLSDLPANTRDSRSRGLPRDRGLFCRGFALLDRDPRELMKTNAGRVGGSIRVTFFAT